MNYFIFLLILLIGCEFHDDLKSPPFDRSQGYVNELCHKATARLQETKGLYLCGTGNAIRDKVDVIALSFFYYGPLTLEDARILLVDTIDCLLEEINQKKELRPHLRRFPFSPKDIEVRIFPKTIEGQEVAAGQLSIITAIGGELRYKKEVSPHEWSKTVLQETYAEAVKKSTIRSR